MIDKHTSDVLKVSAAVGSRGRDHFPMEEVSCSFLFKERKKPGLLLHSCCGPCSTAVIERLITDYDVTVFYYNPCITEEAEYQKRRAEQIRFIEEWNARSDIHAKIGYLDGHYDRGAYLCRVEGLEEEPEGGKRCTVCFKMRLTEAARQAALLRFPYFTTTLTVSPHKDYARITAIGIAAGEKEGVEYLPFDFKKKAGFQRSVQLSREYGLYRQNYCGCIFSKWEREL